MPFTALIVDVYRVGALQSWTSCQSYLESLTSSQFSVLQYTILIYDVILERAYKLVFSPLHLFIVPMEIAEQVVVIYAGVRGHLDKMDIGSIPSFEQAFLKHMRSTHQDIIDTIKKDGQITQAIDDKLKGIVTSFVESFQE